MEDKLFRIIADNSYNTHDCYIKVLAYIAGMINEVKKMPIKTIDKKTVKKTVKKK